MRNAGRPFRGAVRGASAVAAIVSLLAAVPAMAQVTGHVSVIADVLPDLDPADGTQPVGELRARIFAERRDEFGSHLRVTLGGYVDGLIADRTNAGIRLKADSTSPTPRTADSTSAAIIVRPADLFMDVITSRFDLRVGAARLVWGRLDEFQPTDVVNPIDLSRFLMEGRSEARISVGLVRGRLFLPRTTTVEAVVVPAFHRGRFDQLEEESSPFNLTLDATSERGALQAVSRVRDEPSFGIESLQGGVRVTSTTGRVDWAVSGYRGLRAFPIATLGADLKVGPYDETQTPSSVTPDLTLVGAGLQAGPSLVIRESFPRFTMVGGDFETVRGPWGVRGEVAAFVEDELQSTRTARGVPGHSVTAGIGVDRRAGDYRVAANALWSWSAVDADDPVGQSFVGDEELERTDLSLVVAADRSFARETRTLRVFAVYDPADSTAFTRVIGAVSVRDNVWLEGSAGLFTGSSLDVIGRLTRRDFLYARLKVFF